MQNTSAICRSGALQAAMLGALLGLNACGGGAGTTADTPTGAVSVALTDGPSSDFDHAYITVRNLMLHTNPATVDIAQPGWVTLTLPTPQTIDLNHLDNGALAAILTNANLPAATYGQIRLGTYSWDAPLQTSAQATNVASTNNGVTVSAPLQYNSAVVETNGNQYPLEIPSAGQGIVLNGSFTVTSGQPLNLAIEFDAGDDIVRFSQGSGHAYTLNPTLHYYDLSQSGAIKGTIACTAPCSGFVVKAEQLSASGNFYQVARWTDVKSDGSFTLYPVPVTSASQTYDIMVRGHNAQTMIVQSVPVSAGSTPASGATVLSSTALPVTSATEFSATSSASNPSAAWAQFYQTVSGKTYEIRFRQNDPFTGAFLAGTPEPLVNGNVQVGSYAGGGAIALNSLTPQEGPGGYQVWFNAPYFTRTAAVNGNVNAASTAITAPATLLPGSGVATLGSVTGTLAVSNPANWTNGQLVITRLGNIVNTQDISGLVSSSTGGSFTLGSIPAGSTAQPFTAGYYYGYLRLWNVNSVTPNKVTIVALNGYADLRTSNSASMPLTTLP